MTPDTQRIFTVAEVERLERENAQMRRLLTEAAARLQPNAMAWHLRGRIYALIGRK